MKNSIIILIALLIISSCKSSQQLEANFDPIILKVKETSLYAEDVNWKEVNAKFIQLTKGK